MTSTNLTAPPQRKRLHVITWGCQMNVYDSGRMADVLAPLGYAPSDTPEAPATSATKRPKRYSPNSAVYAG
jgi:hypothetical protein